MKADYKAGYLYVLVHPSDPDLYKIGVTVLPPEKRLAQHNSQLDKHAGRIVQATGQKWELKTYIAVPDPYRAERAFWGATPFPDFPFRGGIEVEKMKWQLVQQGLDAAAKAGIRPPPTPPGIEFQCEKGHVFHESPGVIANRKSCPCCVD